MSNEIGLQPNKHRIAAPKRYLETLNRLVEKVGGQPPLFETKQKALMFAAALGFERGLRNPVESRDATTAIRLDVFQTAVDESFINMLAVSATGGLEILDPKRMDECIVVFEEYVHGGLAELQRLCFELAGNPLQTLIGVADDASQPEQTVLPDIDDDIAGLFD